MFKKPSNEAFLAGLAIRLHLGALNNLISPWCLSPPFESQEE